MKVIGDQMRSRFPDAPEQTLEKALRASMTRLIFAWRVGVGALLVSGLVWGLEHENLGTNYVRTMLEPLLTGFEQQIGSRLTTFGMSEQQARYASLALASPLVLALLHQEALNGVSCRPLNIEEFAEEHLQRFLKGWCCQY
jgi:TetR/AcrR family transcriptional regulator, mexJK operon transcriptional repressor